MKYLLISLLFLSSCTTIHKVFKPVTVTTGRIEIAKPGEWETLTVTDGVPFLSSPYRVFAYVDKQGEVQWYVMNAEAGSGIAGALENLPEAFWSHFTVNQQL